MPYEKSSTLFPKRSLVRDHSLEGSVLLKLLCHTNGPSG